MPSTTTKDQQFDTFICVCIIGFGATSVWSAILTFLGSDNPHWAFQAMEAWDFPGFMLWIGSVIGFAIGHGDPRT